MQCDEIIGCLPFCTACHRHEDRPSPVQATTMTPAATTDHKKRDTDGSASVFAAVVITILSLVVVFKFGKDRLLDGKFGRRAHHQHSPIRWSEGQVYEGAELRRLRRSSLTDDLAPRPTPTTTAVVTVSGDAAEERSGSSATSGSTTSSTESRSQTSSSNVVEPPEQSQMSRVRVSLAWSAMGSSPAPVFAIDRDMRIVSWSSGAACALYNSVAMPRFPPRPSPPPPPPPRSPPHHPEGGAAPLRSCSAAFLLLPCSCPTQLPFISLSVHLYCLGGTSRQNRNVGLCSGDHQSSRSASRGAPLRARAREPPMPRCRAPDFSRRGRSTFTEYCSTERAGGSCVPFFFRACPVGDTMISVGQPV